MPDHLRQRNLKEPSSRNTVAIMTSAGEGMTDSCWSSSTVRVQADELDSGPGRDSRAGPGRPAGRQAAHAPAAGLPRAAPLTPGRSRRPVSGSVGRRAFEGECRHCASFHRGSLVCTLWTGTGTWRHPKMPVRWNLALRRRAPRCCGRRLFAPEPTGKWRKAGRPGHMEWPDRAARRGSDSGLRWFLPAAMRRIAEA